MGNTPLHIENSVALNNFLRQAMVKDPKEMSTKIKRLREEKVLRETLNKNFNPNNTSTKDAVIFDNVNTGGASNGPELKIQKNVLLDIDDLESVAKNTSNFDGKPLINKIVESALQEVKENEESTVGGLLGSTHGTNSFTNFTVK